MLIGILGALVGMALSSPLTDASIPYPSLTPDVSGEGGSASPDPRWLDLIRARDASGVRLQAATSSLHVHLTDRTVAGRVPSPAPVSVRASRGETVFISTTVQPRPDSEGYFYVAVLPPWGEGTWQYGYCGEPFLPGDVFWAVQGSTVLSLTLPPFSALADPDTDFISGTAPPSDTVALYLYPRAAPDAVFTQTAVADSEGVYQAHWADLRPGDTGFVAWNQASDRAAYLRFVAPLLQVQVDGAEVVGMAPPCTGIFMEVTDSAGNRLVEHQTTAGRDGRFQTWLWWAEKEEGLPQLLPGYRVRASAAGQAFSTTVLALTAWTDRAAGQVVGEAPPGTPVRVEVAQGPLEGDWESVLNRPPYASVQVTATAGGRYTATMPLAPADLGATWAQGPDGHETFARFAVPYLRLVLGRERFAYGFHLQGQVDGARVPITLTLLGPTGAPKDVRFLSSAGNGFFQDLGRDTDPFLETGDRLTVETPRGVQAALTLPTLTARVDVLSDTVSGEAPPGAVVTVTITAWGTASPAASGVGGTGGGPTPTPPPPPVKLTQVVTAGADGTYVADFRGIADLIRRTVGEAALTTPEGHTVIRPFRAQDCRPVLTAVSVGGNYVSGESGQGCPSATIRLLDPAGVLKAQGYADFTWQDWFVLYFYQPGACPWPDWCGKDAPPVRIFPGDRIEVEVPHPSHDGYAATPSPEVWLFQGEWLENSRNQAFPRPKEQKENIFHCGGEAAAMKNILSFMVAEAASDLCGKAASQKPELRGGDGPKGQGWGEEEAVYTTTVPTLTLEVDRETPALSGWGPPGKTLRVEIYNDTSAIYHAFTATVAPDGRYTLSLTGLYTPTAGDHIFVWWQSGETQFYAADRLSRLRAELFRTALYGLLHPLTPYTVTPGFATGYAGPDGWFWANVADPLFPGDTVAVAMPEEEISLTLPLLTARVDREAKAVSGQAPPGAPLEVSFVLYPFHFSRQVTATEAGTYTVSSPEVPSFTGAWGTLRYTNPQDHQVFLQFGARAWEVTLEERCAEGYADMAGAPFTATLEAADGFTEVLTGTASTSNAFFQVCFSRPIGAGDRLTLAQAGGEASFIVPRLTVSHNWAAQVLEGEAPPGSLVTVEFPRGWLSLSRRTVAESMGRYRLDTRDLGLRVGDSGVVSVADAAENTTRLAFWVQGYRVYLPVVVRD